VDPKKRGVGASERDEFLRIAWRVLVARALDQRRLVFVDEMGTTTSLAPTLRPGQVVVMDNLASHKGEKVRELIDGMGLGVVVPAPLLAGLQTDRGGILEGQGACCARLGPHPRGIGGGAGRGPRRGLDPRRSRLLRALRLPPSGATTTDRRCRLLKVEERKIKWEFGMKFEQSRRRWLGKRLSYSGGRSPPRYFIRG
jgi:hypothetical protein